VVLPTAPRAALGTDLDDSRIPWSPPFTAYLANLPYDVDEDQVKDVFVKCKLKVSQQLAEKLIVGDLLTTIPFCFLNFHDKFVFWLIVVPGTVQAVLWIRNDFFRIRRSDFLEYFGNRSGACLGSCLHFFKFFYHKIFPCILAFYS
jgi:RNA recognition motif-containing protein